MPRLKTRCYSYVAAWERLQRLTLGDPDGIGCKPPRNEICDHAGRVLDQLQKSGMVPPTVITAGHNENLYFVWHGPAKSYMEVEVTDGLNVKWWAFVAGAKITGEGMTAALSILHGAFGVRKKT